MDQVVREQIRQWKAGMEAGNEFVLEEKRRRTPAERWLMHEAFLADHADIGIRQEKPEARVHKLTYREFQERVLARSTRRFTGD
jgi:hypothetical protein